MRSTSPRKERLMLLALVAAVALGPGASAMAQPATAGAPSLVDLTAQQREQRAEHLEQGRRAYEAGRFEEALQAFRNAYNIFSHPDILYRVAECQDKLGREREALANYREFLARSPDAPDAPRIRGIVRALEDRIAREAVTTLQFRTEPQGALVTVDGTEVGRTPLEIGVEPGSRSFVVTLPGHERVEERLRVKEGQSLVLRYHLAPLRPTAAVRTSSPMTPPETPSRTLPRAFGIAGLFSGAIAVVFLSLWYEAAQEVDALAAQGMPTPRYPEALDEQNRWLTFSLISGGLALASLATSAALFLALPAGDDGQAITLAPALTPGAQSVGLGLGLTLRFAD